MTSDSRFRIAKYGRHFAVYDADVLVCLAVYRVGAAEVVRRLSSPPAGQDVPLQESMPSTPALNRQGV